MAETQAVLLIVLLMILQPCLQASDASRTRVLRSVRAGIVWGKRVSGSTGQDEQQRAAPRVEQHPQALTRAVAPCFVEAFSYVKEINWLLSPLNARTLKLWDAEAFIHEHSTKGREAVASFIQPSVVEPTGNLAQHIVSLHLEGYWITSRNNVPIYYRMLNTSGVLTVTDQEGRRYSGCLVNYPKNADLANDAAERIKRAIRDEVNTATGSASMQHLAGSVQNMFRYLTLRDILLPTDNKPYRIHQRRIYLNAIFLYPPIVAYLSSLLPLNRGRISSTSEEAKRLEQAKYSLTFQVMYIVGQLTRDTPVLPRFTAASFAVTEHGVLYLAQAQPAPLNLLTESVRYPGVMACNVPLGPGPSSSSDVRANAADLAVILHNIWCPIAEEIIVPGTDIQTTFSRLTDPVSCYALLPALIRNLIAALAKSELSVSSAWQSPLYDTILSRLDNK